MLFACTARVKSLDARNFVVPRQDGHLSLRPDTGLLMTLIQMRFRVSARTERRALPVGEGARGTNVETRKLKGRRIPYHGQYPLRGRWLCDAYVGLRNGAWALRNSRVGAASNPLALKLVLTEAEVLVSQGESLYDVLEAFAELLARP